MKYQIIPTHDDKKLPMKIDPRIKKVKYTSPLPAFLQLKAE